MKQKVQIRFAEKKDLPEIVLLCEQHAIFEQSTYETAGKAEALKQHFFNHNPVAFCLVAVSEKELIGYATYTKQFSTWDANFYIYMDCLFLKEKSRGAGIGTKLIQRIKEEGAKLTCSLIQWQTPVFNTKAIQFYTKIGASSKSKERFFLTI